MWFRCDKDSCWIKDCGKGDGSIGTGVHYHFQTEDGTPYHEHCLPEDQLEVVTPPPELASSVTIVTYPKCGHRLRVEGSGEPPTDLVHLAQDFHALEKGHPRPVKKG